MGPVAVACPSAGVGPARGRPHDVLLLTLTRDGRLADLTVLEALAHLLPSATDCFVFCSGWITDTAEAREQAAHFFRLLGRALERLGGRVAALQVALHWPSRPFGELDRRGRGAERGLWPELERQLARLTHAQSRALERLLLDLIEVEVPAGPEEEAEADALHRRVRAASGRLLLLAPFEALSCWVMKRRAGQVGERFARESLAPLWQPLSPRPRLHLIGHSFGAPLLTGAVAAGLRPRSLVLLQAPLSAYAFAREVPGDGRPGSCHRVLAERLVSGPIVALRSFHDDALRVLYSLVTEDGPGAAVGRRGRARARVGTSAIGTVGIRGLGAPDIELREAQRIGLPEWAVVNVEGSAVLGPDDSLLGAHQDICHPEVATLVALAAGLLQGHPDGARPRPATPFAA